MMSRYHPLRDHLFRGNASRWKAAFAEIEDILGGPLPASAYKYPAWWSNETVGNHVQKQGWMGAGYRTAELDLAKRTVTFVKGG